MSDKVLKPYLVDVPVRVNIWIRPFAQRLQFEVLKKARPSIMFLQSDGGRNEEEWQAILENRKIFDNEIDWECTVYKIYEDKNLGLYSMGQKVSSFIWEKVDRCIFLEDDHIPSVSFFRYCAELLEKYKDDTRIESICGLNHLERCDNVTSDYFFSRQGSIWGNATWKRAVEQRDVEFQYGKDEYVMKLLKQRAKHNKIFRKRMSAYAKQQMYEGHVAGTEFFREFAMYGQNQLQIVPKVNMIKNVGATENAAHAESLRDMHRGLRRIFNMRTYELEFPLKHAKYVMPDVEYEKKRNKIMAYNCPWITAWRFIEGVFRSLLRGTFFKRIKRRFANKKKVEK